jgi:hypothetical protein
MAQKEIKLSNVRLAFPYLFEPTAFEDDQEKKYEATFIIQKGSATHTQLSQAIKEVRDQTWPNGAPSNLQHCIRDGAERDGKDGFGPDVIFIKARSKKRPGVYDADRTPLTERDDRPYSGCYVNVIVELWGQNTPRYKRVNASLKGVQFYRDGEAFGGGRAASADDFEDVSDPASPPPRGGVRESTADDPLFA